jgi:hypothetical protein
MFNQISMWQMVVDLSLVTAILVIAFKSMKSSRSLNIIPQVVDLENRILKLIAESEASAKHLNDQLLRREQNIHKYVNELDKSEKEISLSVVDGESLTKELSVLCESARREVDELRQTMADLQAERAQLSATSRRSNEFSENSYGAIDYGAPASLSVRSPSKRAPDWMDMFDSPRVEREPVQSRAPSAATLKDLYSTAENMLKKGQKPQEVSRKTNLPFDRVERLAQMIEIEREESVEKRRASSTEMVRDPRLGALGVGRRATSAF